MQRVPRHGPRPEHLTLGHYERREPDPYGSPLALQAGNQMAPKRQSFRRIRQLFDGDSAIIEPACQPRIVLSEERVYYILQRLDADRAR